MKLVTSEQMRAIDHETIHNQGIPGPQLMENAGAGIADCILENLVEDPRNTAVVIFCGKGNNGGDGFVVGRYLHEAGLKVRFYFIGPVEKLSEDARLNYEKVSLMDLELVEVRKTDDLPSELECDIVVDAVFGTGFAGAPRGISAEIIEYINLQDADIAAVDLPSGLNADSGQYEGAVVRADYTFTLALPKYGLYISPGRELSGVVDVVPIGIPDNVIDQFDLNNDLITPDLVRELLPYRKPDGHKGDFGRLFIVAGSTGMTGAASMTADSASRSGCGLITVGCPKTTQPVLAAKLTEVLTAPLPDVAKKGKLALRGLGDIRKFISESDAAIIGPGIGRHRETFELVRRILEKLDRPAVVDADGLNALAGHTDFIRNCPVELVLTPHPGEYRRLVESDIPENYLEKADLLRKTADDWDKVVILKGSPTLVAEPGGFCFFNQTGNSGMASGGSGDVLSGLVGSFLAQGMKPIDAAVAGVFIHGLAGDLAAEALTERAMIATDLIRFLPQAFDLLN